MKKLVVLGGGESGVGAAVLGKIKGYSVFLSDARTIKEKYKDVLLNHKIDWEEGKHSKDIILTAHLVVKSPGIPDTVQIVQELKNKGIQIISEIEFASWFTQATLVAITGSNGKTTTTMLTHHLLQKGGLKVNMAGNIGDSFAQMVAEKDAPFYVLEVSSFQLDGTLKFKPHIAVITNITPDHLDRYDGKFEKYVESKFLITKNQTEEDYLIYDADNEPIVNWLKNNKTKATLVPFSTKMKLQEGAYLDNNSIIINVKNQQIAMSTDILTIQGEHNVKNAMAASTAAHLLKIRKQAIRESLQSFQGVEHRLEKVLKIQNVQYINDSKATNVNATFYALDSVKTPIVWIVGGEDKGNDYTPLYPLVREKVKAIICLGLDNRKIIDSFSNLVDVIVETNSMADAVKKAYSLSEKGDTVLLSPACASFDLFANYEDRGRQFKAAVREL